MASIRTECEVTAKGPHCCDETGKTAAKNAEEIVISNFRTKKIPPLVWRECIKEVWEAVPLLCIHRNGLMQIVSFNSERNIVRQLASPVDDNSLVRFNLV